MSLLHHSNGGNVVNAAKTCGGLYPKVKDTGEELRKQLLLMENQAVLTRGHHAMEGTMVSQYKHGQPVDASWNFTIDGQHSFFYVHYNQNNKKWEVINYNATGVLENWENNAELAQDLAMLSMGDSRHCLEEFLKHQKEMPTSPNGVTVVSQQPLSLAIKPSISGLLIILTCSLLLLT
ncbi:UL16-binding protein 1-like [Mesocricetus auratus]|uniref:UL16-binding protein 1-like n=1 Tax=Mesocricetus auratus TaxID=10036 RepID=A0ABM2YHG4_MESAU|nr:UL16-binding protein 1-like [Mesocricetus auratus]